MNPNDNNKKFFQFEKRTAEIREKASKNKINDQMRLALIFVAVSLLVIIPASVYAGIVIDKKLYNQSKTTVVYVDKEISSGDASKIYETASKNTVGITSATKVVFSDGSQTSSTGSCCGIIWSISENKAYIITCLSMVLSTKELVAKLPDGSEKTLKFVCGDKESDIALLTCESDDDMRSVILGDWETQQCLGSDVYAVGNDCIKQGIVEKIAGYSGDISASIEYIYTNATIEEGGDGCGIYDDGGRLVGMVSHTLNSDSEQTTLALPLSEVKKVAEALIEEGYVPGRVDVDFIRIDIHKDGTLVVSKVEDESSGFAEGDIIQSVDKVVIQTGLDWTKELLSHNVGDTITVVVLRGKESVEIEYTLVEQNNKGE